MRKLKLEALQVESFETTAGAPHMRGTVEANLDQPGTGTGTINPGTGPSDCLRCQGTIGMGCGPATYNAAECGESQYFDCTYGCTRACSDRNSCVDVCYIRDTDNCVREPM